MALALKTSDLREAYGWWTAELAGLFAPYLSARESVRGASQLIIELEGGLLRVADAPAGMKLPEAAAEGGFLAVPLLTSLLGELDKATKRPAVTLRLGKRSYLKRQVALPAAARRDYARLLSLDLERGTPFRHADIYTGHVIEATPSGGGLITLGHFIVKRSLVDPVRAAFAEAGYSVDRIECIDEAGEGGGRSVALDLSPEGTPPGKVAPMRALALIVATGLLAVASLVIATLRYDGALETVRVQSAELRLNVQSARETGERSRLSAQQFEQLMGLRARTVSRALVLNTLTRVIPDTAYLTDLKIENDAVEITGLAVSASALLPLLENSDLFVDATMSSPQVLDPEAKKERFGIRMRLAGSAPPGEAPAPEETGP